MMILFSLFGILNVLTKNSLLTRIRCSVNDIKAIKWGESMEKRRISAKEFVRDLRNGFEDKLLMQKYRLSEIGLGRILDKLIEADLLTIDEL